MAAAADVADPAPVDALVSTRRGEKHVARVRRGQRRPEPGQAVGILVALEAPAGDVRCEGVRLAPDLPLGTADIAELAAGPEAQLAATALDDALWGDALGEPDAFAVERRAVGAGQPGDQVDPLHRHQPFADPLVGAGVSRTGAEDVD